MKRIKITHFCGSLATGGAEIAMVKKITKIPPDIFESRVICLSGEPPLKSCLQKELEAFGVKITHLGVTKYKPWKLIRLWYELIANKPDVLQTWLYLCDCIGGVVGKMAGVRCILWYVCSDTDFTATCWSRGFFARLSSLLSRFVPTKVLCISQLVAEAHKSFGYFKDKLLVARSGCDFSKFRFLDEKRNLYRSQLKIHPDAVVVASLSRYSPIKNYPELLKAYSVVSKQHPNVIFLMGGPSISRDNEEIMSLIRSNNLLQETILVGGISYDEAPVFYSAADIFIASSLHEAGPGTIVEAMGCQRLCVSTPVGFVREVIGDLGVVTVGTDSFSMAQGLLKSLSMSEVEREEKGMLARKKVMHLFCISKSTKKYESMLKNCISRVKGYE